MDTQHIPLNLDELCLRWHQATVRNCMLTWHALAYWLAAESLNAEIDYQHQAAADASLLSDLAMQRVQDLAPHLEAAA